jgi:glutaminyl-peptide cyclotransferase
MTRLPDSLFAEGLTLTSPSRMLVLTWRENLVLVVNPATLQITETLPLPGEGWGLCFDGTSVIRSDGTSTLHFHDPMTMEVRNTLTVALSGAPQSGLNELEYARGYIWANQWLSSRILTIDPATGRVLSVTDFSSITPPGAGAMNGIAYIPETDQFLITGKNWPVMYTVDIRFD